MHPREELDFCLELKPTLHGPLLGPLDGYELAIHKFSSVHLFWSEQNADRTVLKVIRTFNFSKGLFAYRSIASSSNCIDFSEVVRAKLELF
jgi:hypothetical protein